MDSFDARATLAVGDRRYEIFRLEALQRQGFDVQRLPYSLRILLENLLRNEDGGGDVEALAGWDPQAGAAREIVFAPARVLLQDFTGVPAIVDLAAMRDAMARLGGDPARVNPIQPVELVIDHSVQVDAFGSAQAFHTNEALDYERNRERYALLKWGQQAFRNFKVAPPNVGICHQVNLEYLARVVFSSDELPEGGAGAPVRPAVDVYERYRVDLATIAVPEPPPGLVATVSKEPTVSGVPLLASAWQMVFALYGYLLPFVLYAAWTSLALWDLARRDDLPRWATITWIVAILVIPFIGVLAYHVAGRPHLPAWLRTTMIAGGLAAYVVAAAVAGTLGGIV